MASLGRGAHFGEMALLNDRPRAASVVAATACRTLTCDRASLSSLLMEHPTLASHFYRALATALSARLDDIYAFYDAGDRAEGGGVSQGRPTLFQGTR